MPLSRLSRVLSPRPFFPSAPARHYRQPALDPPIPSPRARDDAIPPYPLGPQRVYKQANMGLYGGQRIRFGNRVSERNEVKTRRKWRPNVHQKRLWSDALGVHVRTRVTTRVLRTVDKVGGLDEYLLGTKSARVRELGPWGWRLRWRLMQAPAVRERFRREREALGLPEEEPEVEQDAALADGVSAAEMMEETDRQIEEGDEFVLGGEEEEEKGFMEEKPGKEP